MVRVREHQHGVPNNPDAVSLVDTQQGNEEMIVSGEPTESESAVVRHTIMTFA